MRIRWKLLVILLVVALPPLGLATWFHQTATRDLAMGLVNDRNAQSIAWAETYVRDSLAAHTRLVSAYEQLLEAGLSAQVRAIENQIMPEGNLGIGQAGKILADLAQASQPFEIAVRYIQVGTSTISQTGSTTRVGHNPFLAQIAKRFDKGQLLQRFWLQRGARLLRIAAVRSPGTTQNIFTAIEIETSVLLRDLAVPDGWHAKVARFAVAPMILGNPIMFSDAQSAIEPLRMQQLKEVMVERAAKVVAGQIGVVWQNIGAMPYLVGFARPASRALVYMVAVPKNLIVSEAQSGQVDLKNRLNRVLAFSGGVFAVFAAAIFFLSILGARSITGPLHVLADAVARAAKGDLSAQATLQTGDEIEEVANQFNAMLPRLRDQIRMRDSLELARDIQQNLLPSQNVTLPGFEIVGTTSYCDETGGDYYDFLPIAARDDDGALQRIGIAIGDVAGHGISAALVMTIVRSLLRALLPLAPLAGSGLADTMKQMNRELVRDSHQGRFVTLFVGELVAGQKTFHWVNVGHEPGLLFDPATDEFHELAGSGIPLGITEDWEFSTEQAEIWTPGSVLVLITDGITEARDEHGEQFGRIRLRALIRENASSPAQELCSALSDAVVRHRGSRKADDDATIVVIKAI